MAAPKTSDGKPIILPNIFPGGVVLYTTGRGDDRVAGRGSGQQFVAQSDAEGDTTVEFSFNDWIYAAGGGVLFEGAALGDSVSMHLVAPPTATTLNSNNQGSCHRIEVAPGSGMYFLLPANGNGSHDVDVDSSTPVPAYDEETEDPDGWWDWNDPDTGLGAISPNAHQEGKFDLYSFEITLAKLVVALPLVGTRGQFDITVSAIKPKKILPHWKMRLILHNSGHAGLKVAWYLTTARRKTT